ncbi:MAG: DUF2630 family protein [Thermomicrobiales bacterium]|jgi:hypothetical protein|nr:hypothetical protein [Thermomicrobiales bacterium]
MMATTSADTSMVADDLVDRINTLAAERTALYRRASDGATPEQRARLKEVEAELAALWVQRRRARAGRDDADDVPVRRAA